jgi:hypothetical protein
MNNNLELWVDLPESPEIYQVSNRGNMRNKQTNKILKGFIDNYGYRRYMIPRGNRKYLQKKGHRLIYYAFNPDTDKKLVIHHIDGNKLNNSLNNLQPMRNEDHSRLENMGTGVNCKFFKHRLAVICAKTKKLKHIFQGRKEIDEIRDFRFAGIYVAARENKIYKNHYVLKVPLDLELKIGKRYDPKELLTSK